MSNSYDVTVIGAGLAGLTAAMYTARYGLKTLVVEKLMTGGQVFNVEKLENFPGFPHGISGAELGPLVQEQATSAGAEFQLSEVSKIETGTTSHIVTTTEGDIESKSIIIACGSSLRKLGVPGEEEFLGRGVSQCASCDGSFFYDEVVGVVGGGDSALDEALVLTDYASKILIFHRGDSFRAQQAIQSQILDHPKIEVRWKTQLESIMGTDTVDSVALQSVVSGETTEEKVAGVFVFVGLDPNTQFLEGVLTLDGAGHVPVDLNMATSVPGIFAAGDLRQNSVKQLISAAGDGGTAAVSVANYIANMG